MTTELPPCPKCASPYTYEDGALLICPECAHEWSASEGGDGEGGQIIRDCVGNTLQSGDTVTIAKDLKLGNQTIKVGTKVKNIRVLPPEEWIGDHDIDAKVPGFGPMGLKSSVVKKVTE
ncbi:MAG: zinc ribbon domain-containing protein YjdM [Bdellovibrionales bacterium]